MAKVLVIHHDTASRSVLVNAAGLRHEVSDARRRELAAVGSVLVAIEDGIGLQAAIDPDFDVEGALAMVQTMIGDALARLKDG